MSELGITPVMGSSFEQVVDSTSWNEDILSQLRVANGLGWLVCVDQQEKATDLVGFSVESVGNRGVLFPPANIFAVQERFGRPEVGHFNADGTAKGLGSTIVNTPRALQPGSAPVSKVAVRSIPFTPEDIHTRTEPTGFLGRKWRLARHGGLLLASVLVDSMSYPFTGSVTGTELAIRYMERDYGDARLVHMPDLPPIWQEQQEEAGVAHDVMPHAMLVRGGHFAGLNPMTRVGSYAVSRIA
jgi:hypothetical protein